MNDQEKPDTSEDEVEGHRYYSESDRTIKHDVTPVVSEESADDTEEQGAVKESG